VSFYVADDRVPGEIGFRVVAGPDQGLGRVLLAAGTLPAGDLGWVHEHGGDEVIRVVSGRVTFTVGGQVRVCGPGELAVIPPGVPHGFVVGGEQAVIEVVAEQGMGSWIPVRDDSGARRLVEVHRAGVPFDRDPAAGAARTTEAELADLVGRTTDPLPE
jgi:mannose-6-phosphate isomerase-like protein (cupin superfamily)